MKNKHLAMYLPFDQLPDHARIWVYVSPRRFTPSEQEWVQSGLIDFCASWATHGKGMPTSFTILEEQLLVLAVDESQLGASGCSIDSSVRVLKEFEQKFQINLVDQGKLTLRDPSGQVRVLPALGIKSRIQGGEIALDQEVMLPTIQTKAELSDLWQPLSKSWLRAYFPN